MKEHYDVGGSDDDEDYIRAWRAALAQSALNIAARERNKGDRKL